VSNLALTCPHCNAHKWTAAEGPDPDTHETVPFFNPRQDNWSDHFEWAVDRAGLLIGRTPAGRATISALHINDPDMIALRVLLAELGLFAEAGGEGGQGEG
jgi:hypothetical protein